MLTTSQFLLLQRRLFARSLTTVRAFSSRPAAAIDDEDNVPDNLKEDRALHLAQTSPHLKNDPLLSELLNREHSMGSLQSFYDSKQKEMTLLHHSFLLYKVNQVFKEIKRRHATKTEPSAEGEEETTQQPMSRLEGIEDAKTMANRIFKQVCFYINRNAA